MIRELNEMSEACIPNCTVTGIVPDTDKESEAITFEQQDQSHLYYSLTTRPSAPVTFSVGLQHVFVSLGTCMTVSSLVSDVVCAEFDSPIRSKLLGTTLFLCGLSTILQTYFGVRLPIFQGPSVSFVVPLIALQSSDSWSCNFSGDKALYAVNVTSEQRRSNSTPTKVSLSADEKLQLISGSLMVSSLMEALIGGTGLIGLLLRFIGPITVAPTISLIALSLYKVPIGYSRPCPPLAFGAAVLILVFGLYMGHIKIPLLSCNRANNGQRQRSYFPLFQLFPILLSAVIVWTISAILSVSDTLSSNPDDITYKARVDAKINIMQGTPWFSYPYPGQFGGIKFSVAVFVGFVAATCASVIESVGDYCAASKACEVPPPPKHAISRGIMIEGIGSILAGALGAGHAMTSYSTNIATISLSKTACRVAMLSAGLTLIVGSFIGKFGAALAIIPNPVLGGILIVNLGMLFSIGLSTLGNVDLSSSRNLAIIGVAIFIGMMLPEWTKLYPDFIKAGSLEGDAVLRVIFGTPMFLGGIIAFILDNTVKGSDRERGLVSWRNGHSDDVVKYDITRIDQESPALLRSLSIDEIYGWKIMKRLQIRFQYLRRVPFLPPYVEECGDLAT